MVERRLRNGLLALAIALMVGSCAAGSGTITVTDARVGRSSGPNAALYLTASSGGEADRLLGAETAEAALVEIHETVQGDDGTMGMRPVEGLDLPASGTLLLQPGGSHLMLVDVSPLEIGESVDVTLVWEQAGTMDIEAEVVAPAEIMSNGG
jgi:periplasmic copper chaperone A